jgi:branched-chain amino acid transport system permease protein
LHVPASWRENAITAAWARCGNSRAIKPVFWALLLIAAMIWPFTASRGAVDVMTLALIYVMLGLGLNIVVGFAGLLVLGYAAFYAVGAYTYACWRCTYELVVLAVPAGRWSAGGADRLPARVCRCCGCAATIWPSSLSGFGEITRLLLNNLNILTGGPDGIGNIPRPTLFGLEFNRRAGEGGTTFHEFLGIDYSGNYGVIFLYLLGLVLVLLILFVINRLLRMPLGRAWEALREDEIACRSLGLNPTAIKLSALTLSAAFRRDWLERFSPLARVISTRNRSRSSNRRWCWRLWCWAVWVPSFGVMLAAIAITALAGIGARVR